MCIRDRDNATPGSTAPDASTMPDPSKADLTYAPQSGSGSIQAVIDAVKAFQKKTGLNPSGILDPKTMAAILSQSGKVAKDTAAKMQQPSDAPASGDKLSEDDMGGTMSSSMPSAPSAMPVTETIQDTLRRKAALHEGYACGLMAESHHKCVHPEGSHEHLHWHHGYSKGLAECTGVWGSKGTF